MNRSGKARARRLWSPMRAALTLAVAAGGLGLALGVGIDRADATVYELGGSSRSRELELLDPTARPTGSVRLARLNGSPVKFQVAESRKSIRALFDGFEARLADPAAKPSIDPAGPGAGSRTDPGEAGVRAGGSEGELARALEAFRMRGGYRSISLEDGSQGVFGALGGPSLSSPDWPLTLLAQVRRSFETGTLDAFASPVAVVAYRDEEAALTTFVQAVPQPGFRWDVLLPTGDEDVPGQDPAWLKRPSGAVRVVAFEEVGPLSGYGLRMYGSGARPDQVVAELEASGISGGWSEGPSPRWSGLKEIPGQAPAAVLVSAGERRFESVIVVLEAGAL